MSKTLIIGASGQIGKITTQLLLNDQHQVVALVRDKNKLNDLSSPYLSVFEQDLEGDFSQPFAGCEQVIFVAGSGGNTDGDKTLLIDLWAAVKAINYAKQYDIKNFIMVSSIGANDPDAITSDLKPYLVAKHMADEHLINSGLNYTIVRPGSLTNDSASLKITTQRPSERKDAKVSRENVANALLEVVKTAPGDNRIFELFDAS